jgi:hypothetical protein
MTDVELARAFERGEVPNGSFHHEDHLRLAWVYLDESPSVDEALARTAGALRRFAAAAGRSEKYSDAVTAFWVYQLASVRAMMPGADCATVLNAYPRLLNRAATLRADIARVSAPVPD